MSFECRQKTLRYSDLDNYCDSLERDGCIQVILKANREYGFALWVENAGDIRRVVGNGRRQVWFRTVDQALDELANIPYLSDRFIVDRKNW